MMTRGNLMMAVPVLWVCAAHSAPARSQRGDTPPKATAPDGLPAPPQLRLVPIHESSEDEAAYVRSIANRAAALADRAAQTDDPLTRVELLLAAANQILGYELEPACTRKLLGIAGPAPPGSAGRGLAQALDRATSMIAQADATLMTVESPGPEPTSQVNRRRRQIRILFAFATAIRAYLLNGERNNAAVGGRDAAAKLSPVLEDADPQVAAAAKLWQACLRAQEADPTPALARLDPVLSDLPGSSGPYGFFARLMSCRLLARRGHPATALSLLLQIEERCNDDWLNQEDRPAALRTVALIRTQILREWYERLAPDAHAQERQWCAGRIKRIIDMRLAGDGPTVSRLAPAMPIIVEPPEPQSPSNKDAPDGE